MEVVYDKAAYIPVLPISAGDTSPSKSALKFNGGVCSSEPKSVAVAAVSPQRTNIRGGVLRLITFPSGRFFRISASRS